MLVEDPCLSGVRGSFWARGRAVSGANTRNRDSIYRGYTIGLYLLRFNGFEGSLTTLYETKAYNRFDYPLSKVSTIED